MPTGRFLYIRNYSPLVSHVLLLVIGCFFQLQVFIVKPCCKSFHRHHCKPHASQSISSCTTLRRNRDRQDVYHTFSTESRKKQSFSSVNNHCHCIRINLLQLFWFWVSFTWVGQVMQNHAERNTHIALGLLCCICFGFGLFCIHLGKVNHAKRTCLCSICLGFGCGCSFLFDVWLTFPTLGSEKLWQFLQAHETKQKSILFFVLFYVLWFKFHGGLVKTHEFDGATKWWFVFKQIYIYI